MGDTPNIPGGGGHVYGREPLTSAEALAEALHFAREHPQPPIAHRTVDYFTAPMGFEQFPVPPGYERKAKPRRRASRRRRR